MAMAVGDREAQHHHVHFHAEHRALGILRAEQGRARCNSEKTAPRYQMHRSPLVTRVSKLRLPGDGRRLLAGFVAHIVAHLAQRAKHRRPILQMRGKNMLY